MRNAVYLRQEIHNGMLRHARSDPRIECCGLLAGTADLITAIFPAQNALASSTAYEIAPRELFALFRRIREGGLVHSGIYHSHPAAENTPSSTDIARAYYPDVLYFIISPRPEAADPIRAFSLRDGRAEEIEIMLSSD